MNDFRRLAALVTLVGCGGTQSHASTPAPPAPTDLRPATVVSSADLDWEPLNPARGAASPKAATLWGDRNSTEPTGFLVRFVDGFESPPHIHNVSYRAVVIQGAVHNAHPGAERMWMPVGSFWTQPKGAVHITAARGHDTVAFVEIDEGPYLVRPPDQAYSTDETPRNVRSSELVWTPASDADTPSQNSEGPAAETQISTLWGDPNRGLPGGQLVKFSPGTTGTLRSAGSSFRAVVVQGRPAYRVKKSVNDRALAPGSYVRSSRAVQIFCAGRKDCVVYVKGVGDNKAYNRTLQRGRPETSNSDLRP